MAVGAEYARTYTSFQNLVMKHIDDTEEVTSLRISFTSRDEEWIEVTDQKQIQMIMDDLSDIRLMKTKDNLSFESQIYKMEIAVNKYDYRFTIVYGEDDYLYLHANGKLKNYKSYAQGYKIISDYNAAGVLSLQQ